MIDEAVHRQWDSDGWCLVDGLFSPAEVAAAQAALPALFPTAEEFAADADPVRNAPFRDDSHRVMPRFPFESAALNDLAVHDRVIDLAEVLLGAEAAELRLYQASLSAKYGEGRAERRTAAARGLRQPHLGRAPSRAGVRAARDVRLPE